MRAAISDNLKIDLEIGAIKKQISQNHKNSELIFNYLDELIESHGKEDQKSRQKIGYKK